MITNFRADQSLPGLTQGQPNETKTAPCPSISQAWFVGQVESFMTRHATEGNFHFVLLALSDGRTFRGKWRAIPDELLPVLGDVIRIKIEQNGFELVANNIPPVSTANSLAGKVCYRIKNWQVIQAPYSLERLD